MAMTPAREASSPERKNSPNQHAVSKQKPKTYEQYAVKILLSQAAATCSESATFPLDLMKTRLQIQGERGSAVFEHQRYGMVGIARGIVMNEGVFSLWRGLAPALYRHYIYTGTRMVSYEFIRDSIAVRNDGQFTLWMSMLSGLTAGCAGQLIASPTDLVKIQVQMEGKRIVMGHKPRFSGPFYFNAFSQVYKKVGIRGLWRGWFPNVQRSALVNMGDLATYDTVKRKLIGSGFQDTTPTHVICSLCSGLVASLVSIPADVVKTRIMNQPTDIRGRGKLYKSSFDCIVKTFRSEGFFAFYKGFLPAYPRMGLWSLIFWISYEKIRVLTGVGNF